MLSWMLCQHKIHTGKEKNPPLFLPVFPQTRRGWFTPLLDWKRKTLKVKMKKREEKRNDLRWGRQRKRERKEREKREKAKKRCRPRAMILSLSLSPLDLILDAVSFWKLSLVTGSSWIKRKEGIEEEGSKTWRLEFHLHFLSLWKRRGSQTRKGTWWRRFQLSGWDNERYPFASLIFDILMMNQTTVEIPSLLVRQSIDLCLWTCNSWSCSVTCFYFTDDFFSTDDFSTDVMTHESVTLLLIWFLLIQVCLSHSSLNSFRPHVRLSGSRVNWI